MIRVRKNLLNISVFMIAIVLGALSVSKLIPSFGNKFGLNTYGAADPRDLASACTPADTGSKDGSKILFAGCGGFF